MTKQAFIAFDTVRSSAAAYTWASMRQSDRSVRFHTSEHAARNAAGRFGWIEPTRIATRDEIRAAADAKRADAARRAARSAAFEAAWIATPGDSDAKRAAAYAAVEAI